MFRVVLCVQFYLVQLIFSTLLYGCEAQYFPFTLHYLLNPLRHKWLSPLEKVPFATFYPRWKYLCGTYFSKKRLFQVDSWFKSGYTPFLARMTCSAVVWLLTGT